MTATANATGNNGKAQRKQLSDQLDRLDTILDALAEALPAAVADACREGARQAVKDAVVEILASPELRALIAGVAAARSAPPPAPQPEPAPARPRLWTRVWQGVKAAKEAVVGRCRAAAGAVTGTVGLLSALMPLRRVLLIGAGVGLVVGAVSYICPHGVSAAVSGLGGACTAVAAQVGGWARSSARAFGLAAL